MATDKEINEQAEDFLNAMAPKPVPPPSRVKKDTAHKSAGDAGTSQTSKSKI